MSRIEILFEIVFVWELYEIVFSRITTVENDWRYEKLCIMIGVMKISVE
jgi:hypothetical protein